MRHTAGNGQLIPFRSNVKLARSLWGPLSSSTRSRLRELTKKYALSIAAGDLLLLDSVWFVTHAGLLRIAQRRRCYGIKTSLQKEVSDPIANRWVFKATVYKTPSSKGFVAFGDADPSNVSPLVRGAELRIGETRAVNRALRKAYGVGLCSVEELGSMYSHPEPAARKGITSSRSNGNVSGSGQPRLRDRLCLLIRQYNLDPTLVKAYAADFCGTQTLKEASRDLVESFITELAAAAKKDRDALVCKLNSYAQPVEGKP